MLFISKGYLKRLKILKINYHVTVPKFTNKIGLPFLPFPVVVETPTLLKYHEESSFPTLNWIVIECVIAPLTHVIAISEVSLALVKSEQTPVVVVGFSKSKPIVVF